MKFWLLEDGERSGPFENYVITKRVESGELDGSSLVWYEGAEDWMRLDEVPMLRSMFEESEVKPVTEAEVEQVAERLDEVMRMMEPPKLHMTRRFFARLFDAVLYLSLILSLFQSVEVIPRMGMNLWTSLFIGLGYVLIDAGMTHAWRSSPGKWLLGIRVTDATGHAIGLGGSVMRSLRVWVLGWGMWIIPELSLLVTWFMARRLKYFIWDFPRRYRVVCKPFEWTRALALAGGFLVMGVYLDVVMPEGFEELLEQRIQEIKAGG